MKPALHTEGYCLQSDLFSRKCHKHCVINSYQSGEIARHLNPKSSFQRKRFIVVTVVTIKRVYSRNRTKTCFNKKIFASCCYFVFSTFSCGLSSSVEWKLVVSSKAGSGLFKSFGLWMHEISSKSTLPRCIFIKLNTVRKLILDFIHCLWWCSTGVSDCLF